MKNYQSIYQGTPPYLTVQFSKSPRQQQYKDMFILTFFPYFKYSSFTFIWIILITLVFICSVWMNGNSESNYELYQFTQKNYPYYVVKQKQYYRLLCSLVLFKNLSHFLITAVLMLSVGSYVQHILEWKKIFLLILLSGFCGCLSVCLFSSKPSVDGFTPISGLIGFMIGYSMIRWKNWIKYSNERAHNILGIFVIILIGVILTLFYPLVSFISTLGALVFGFFFSLQDDTARKGWTTIRILGLIFMSTSVGLLVGFTYFKANPYRV